MEEAVITPWITNEAVVFGLLMSLLGGIFWASSHPRFSGFFKVVPALLLCYFLPSLLTNFHIVPKEHEPLFCRFAIPATCQFGLAHLEH